MDFSKEYIKMCDCPEIQEYADTDGFRSLNILPNVYWDKEHGFSSFYRYKHSNNIWLPRQDQLQEMVKKDLTDIELIEEIYDYLCENPNEIKVKADYSMEMVWLAYMMKEKFSKTWNGEEWG